MDGWRTSEQLLIRVRAGNDGVRSFRFRGSAGNMCRFELDKPIQAGQPVDLEFIPQQPLRFEFMVAPPQQKPDKRDGGS